METSTLVNKVAEVIARHIERGDLMTIGERAGLDDFVRLWSKDQKMREQGIEPSQDHLAELSAAADRFVLDYWNGHPKSSVRDFGVQTIEAARMRSLIDIEGSPDFF